MMNLPQFGKFPPFFPTLEKFKWVTYVIIGIIVEVDF